MGRGNGAVADSFTYQTAEPDIFVGGDVYTGPKFAIDAVAAGKEGAISIHRFVHEGQSLTIGRDRRHFVELIRPILFFRQRALTMHSVKRPTMQVLTRHKIFPAICAAPLPRSSLSMKTARRLGCGASVVDPNVRLGCAVCTTKCEFDAIHIERVFDGKMYTSEDKMKAILPPLQNAESKFLQKRNPSFYNERRILCTN